MLHHFLRMTEYPFSEALNMDLWDIAEVVTYVKNSHLSPDLRKGTLWVIFVHFSGSFLLSSFSRERFNILSWSFVKMLLVLLRYKISQHDTLCWESFWVISWLILLYILIFLESRSIYSHENICRCSWYTPTVTKLFFIHVMSHWGSFWYMFLYFLRIIQIFLRKFYMDGGSTNLMVTALKRFIRIIYFSAGDHFGVFLDQLF